MKKIILLLSIFLLMGASCTASNLTTEIKNEPRDTELVNEPVQEASPVPSPSPTPPYYGTGDFKPVIYLYPTQTQNVDVRLDYDGDFTVTYPEYKEGWNILAYPDGRIINLSDDKEYSYLFWEGQYKEDIDYDLSSGFIVSGEQTADFLQEKLAKLGLTPKEYNEFIVYWLPQLLHNKYNLVHFATKEEYNNRVRLDINPNPDSILRIFAVFKPLDKIVEIQPQEIKPFSREGFAVIEWGGTIVR